ncbi:MAG TPA: M23 family metallopeptidase [Gemmatimonadaceae bacterium]
MRSFLATFFGAFFFALIYQTKPVSSDTVTLARSGATALVVDTAALDSSATQMGDTSSLRLAPDTLVAPQFPSTGSSHPPVGPADLESLKRDNMIIPVAGVAPKDLIDSFDDKRGTDRTHNALDIMARRNTPVVAALPGTILKLHNSTAGGLTVYQSDSTFRFVMMYGHLESYRPGIVEGQSVKRGEIIGFVGSTGNANVLAPHLHFQVTRNDNMKEWWKGTPINPFPVLRPQG